MLMFANPNDTASVNTAKGEIAKRFGQTPTLQAIAIDALEKAIRGNAAGATLALKRLGEDGERDALNILFAFGIAYHKAA